MVVAPPVALLLLVVPVFGNACAESEPGEMGEEQCLLSLQRAHAKQSTSKEANTEQMQSAAPNGKTGMIKWGGWGNYCLSVIDNKFTFGQKMQLWDCLGSDGQIFNIHEWRPHAMGFGMTLAAHDDDFGLSAAYSGGRSGYANGDKLEIDWLTGKQWTWDGSKEIRPATAMSWDNDPSSYCVTVDGNNAFNGARIQLWKCTEPEEWQIAWTFVEKSSSSSPSSSPSSDCTEVNHDMYASGKKVACCQDTKECLKHGKYICIGWGYSC